MAGFENHSRFGSVAAALFALGAVIVSVGLIGRHLAAAIGGLAFVTTYVGAIFPDVDSPSSIPYRRLVRILRVAVIALGIFAGYRVRDLLWLLQDPLLRVSPITVAPDLQVLGVWVLILLVLVWLVAPVVTVAFGEHRTWTHNLTYVAGLSFLGGLFLFGVFLKTLQFTLPVTTILALVPTVGFYVGVVIHVGVLDR